MIITGGKSALSRRALKSYIWQYVSWLLWGLSFLIVCNFWKKIRFHFFSSAKVYTTHKSINPVWVFLSTIKLFFLQCNQDICKWMLGWDSSRSRSTYEYPEETPKTNGYYCVWGKSLDCSPVIRISLETIEIRFTKLFRNWFKFTSSKRSIK